MLKLQRTIFWLISLWVLSRIGWRAYIRETTELNPVVQDWELGGEWVGKSGSLIFLEKGQGKDSATNERFNWRRDGDFSLLVLGNRPRRFRLAEHMKRLRLIEGYSGAETWNLSWNYSKYLPRP
jgi:hypothetical protein